MVTERLYRAVAENPVNKKAALAQSGTIEAPIALPAQFNSLKQYISLSGNSMSSFSNSIEYYYQECTQLKNITSNQLWKDNIP